MSLSSLSTGETRNHSWKDVRRKWTVAPKPRMEKVMIAVKKLKKIAKRVMANLMRKVRIAMDNLKALQNLTIIQQQIILPRTEGMSLTKFIFKTIQAPTTFLLLVLL